MDQVRATLPPGTPLEIWFADEARIGQKNKITRRWARRGTRPSAPHDQRTKSASIFGAICPADGKAAGLVLPFCNTETMNLHLIEISQAVAPGAHAVLLMDQAGWHTTPKLDMPENITIIPLPAKAPELNPVENIWQFMRENWLSTGCSPLTATSSTIAAMPGTGSSISLGASCPSANATGRRSSDQWDLV